MRIRYRGFLFLGLFGGAVVLGLVDVASADAKKDFAALEKEMEKAEQEYAKAMEALAGKDGNVVLGDGKNMPADKRMDVLKKMDALCETVAGKPEGGEILANTFRWSMMVDFENTLSRFETLVTKFPDEPMLAEVIEEAAFAVSVSDAQDKWFAAFEKLERTTKRDENKAAAMFITGQVQLDKKKLPEAKATFEKVAKLAKDEETVRKAKGYIFEIEHLQIGMTAPDFSAKTLDGKEVSLKSLRGKTVLLNFWASW